jgi:site-specific DNA-methyltransferase (adenine-specific)
MFSKIPKGYYFNYKSIMEPAVGKCTGKAATFKRSDSQRSAPLQPGNTATHRSDRPDVSYNSSLRRARSVWNIATSKPVGVKHVATFPEALAERMILAGCPREGIVLDPFFGSGTTGIAARRLGRGCIGIELNKETYDAAYDRFWGPSPLRDLVDTWRGNGFTPEQMQENADKAVREAFRRWFTR